MALQKFRRHTRKCTKDYSPNERKHDDCHCNYSVEGMLAGKFIRKTAGTPYADKVNAQIRAAEKSGYWTDVIAEKKKASPVGIVAVTKAGYTVQKATEDFIDYIKSTTDGDVASGTAMNYNATMRDFAAWCHDTGILYVKDLTTVHLVNYKDTWGKPNARRTKALSPATQKEYVSRLKALGDFCEERGHCLVNFAGKLKHPKAGHLERPPFSDQEMAALEHFAMIVKDDRPADVSGYRVLTQMLMMRWAGMAICDASLLRKEQIVGDEVHYYREKTKRQPNRVLCKVPLPAWLLERLKVLEETEGLYQGKYYFCNGSTELSCVGTTWRRYLTPIFAAAGIEGCLSHRFRHTFAEDMLTRIVQRGFNADGTIRYGLIDVSMVAGWLGHASELTTITHYRATIKKRDGMASDILRAMHAEDAKKRAAA